MWITESFLGTKTNGVKYLFFLLYEDYIEEQTQFAQELNLELERFARNLGDNGALVRPFQGDIESSRKGILDKNWTESEKQEISKTPALLMIDKNFDTFNPKEDQWLLFNFGEKLDEGIVGTYKYKEPLKAIVEAAKDDNIDIFEIAHKAKHELSINEATKIFTAKPGVFGFSIDLIKAGDLIVTAFKRNKAQIEDITSKWS